MEPKLKIGYYCQLVSKSNCFFAERNKKLNSEGKHLFGFFLTSLDFRKCKHLKKNFNHGSKSGFFQAKWKYLKESKISKILKSQNNT